jgi:hypothetical protein
MVHRLYCPACEEVVSIPYATEIAERCCPNVAKCGTGADGLWPSKVMFERSIQKQVE